VREKGLEGWNLVSVSEGFVESDFAVDLLDFALFVDVDVNDWAFQLLFYG
jgi:hypothetical protein